MHYGSHNKAYANCVCAIGISAKTCGVNRYQRYETTFRLTRALELRGNRLEFTRCQRQSVKKHVSQRTYYLCLSLVKNLRLMEKQKRNKKGQLNRFPKDARLFRPNLDWRDGRSSREMRLDWTSETLRSTKDLDYDG